MRGSFLMLVYAEMYGAKYGMGFFVRKYSEFGMYQNVWCGFIFMVLVLVFVMQIFEHIKSHLLKWSIVKLGCLTLCGSCKYKKN